MVGRRTNEEVSAELLSRRFQEREEDGLDGYKCGREIAAESGLSLKKAPFACPPVRGPDAHPTPPCYRPGGLQQAATAGMPSTGWPMACAALPRPPVP